MSDFLTNLANPVVWLGIIAFIVGVIAHLMGAIFLTVTSAAYLEFAKTCFLFSIAAGVLRKASS